MNARHFVSTLGILGMAWVLLAPWAGAAPAASKDIKLGASCVTAECHGEVVKAPFLHGPTNMNQCEPCHVPVAGKHDFQPVASGRDLCVTCHEIEAPLPVVHGPFATDCAACHDPHGGNNRHFLPGGEGSGSCRMCHDDVTKGATHQHGPVAAGECMVCHTPHQSEHKGLLVEPRVKLCMGCQVDVEHALKDAISVHQPVGEVCEGCHLPHGGNVEFFLPEDSPGLCLKCHGDFMATTANAKTAHGAMTDGKSCRNCHAPHASSQSGLLATDTSTLCLSCHNEQIDGTRGPVDNIDKQITESQFLHGPVRDKNCAACHSAHGSDHASILKREFPRDFYAPYKEGAYDLCFECHDRSVALDAKSTTTGFRDGDRNLHHLHVNREKGRTCRACHAEHASNQPHHVRSEVPFGRWAMKVEFTKTDTGGTCATGCHQPYEYDRVTPKLSKAATP